MSRKQIVFILLLTVIVTGVYWRSLNTALIWDSKIFLEDSISVIENRPLLSAFQLGFFFQQHSDKATYYRPLTLMTYMLENRLWGIRPMLLKAVNLLIFLAALAVFYLLFRYQTTGGYFPEIATLFFALFPLHLDNILWVVGRGDLLLLLWGGLTFLFLELYIRRERRIYLAGSCLFFILGLLSKEAFLFFLPVLLIYEAAKRRRISAVYHLANFGAGLLFLAARSRLAGIANPSLTLSPKPLQNLETLLASIGYYVRTLLFPFRYDAFIPQYQLVTTKYVLFGAAGVLILALLIYLAVKDRRLWIPVGLILCFFAGHIYMVFSSLLQFKVYSRYLAVPALGVAWILAHYLTRVRERLRFAFLLVLLLAFIPTILMNALAYRSEIDYWQRARRSIPNNGYILYEIARTHFESGNLMSAELTLNQTLSAPLIRDTASLVSQLYAELELKRGDYPQVIRWLDSLEEMEQSFEIRFSAHWTSEIVFKRALVHGAKGETEQCEALLLSGLEGELGAAGRLKFQRELFQLYVGRLMWDRAEELELGMRAEYGDALEIDSRRIRDRLSSATPEEMIDFFILYKNYPEAAARLEALPSLDLEQSLTLVKAFYFSGRPEAGDAVIERLRMEAPDDIERLNRLGHFYLRDLFRVRKAVGLFDKSLAIKKRQPEIQRLYQYLIIQYLERLREVWPEIEEPPSN